MKKYVLLLSALPLFVCYAKAQNSFHFNSTEKGNRQDIGVSSGILTIGQFVNNCDGSYPDNIEWKKIMVGIGTPNPTEQLHTTQGVRFEGLTQDDKQNQVLVQDNTGKLYWRDAGTIGGGGGTGNFWSLTGNAITSGQFLGTTVNQDLVFKRNNAFAGFLGLNNTSYGLNALDPSSSGVSNTAFGSNTLSSNTSGYNNTSHGYYALSLNTSGSDNTAIGKQTLQFNTTGIENAAIGAAALERNTTASGNTGLGVRALATNQTGTANTAVGRNALYNNQSDNNTATGSAALLTSSSGSQNTANGALALFNVTTGSGNTAIGYNAGAGILTGSGNTIVGANVTGLSASLSNTIILADGSGTKRLYVDNGGHAGLATTAPTAALHVNCTGIPVTGASNVRFENLQQGGGSYLVIDNDGYVKRSSQGVASRPAPQEDIEAIKAELAELKAQLKTLLAAQNNTGHATDKVPASSLEVVPTPFQDHVKVMYTIAGFSGRAALQIVDANGALLQTISLTQAQGTVEVNNLNPASGMVLFNIVAEGRTIISQKSVRM